MNDLQHNHSSEKLGGANGRTCDAALNLEKGASLLPLRHEMGDLSHLGSGERNVRSTGPKGPSERERASHWVRGEVASGHRGAKLLPHINHRGLRNAILSIALLSFSTATTFSQRAFNLNIASTNNGMTISWPCQSATPLGETPIIPLFIVQRSTDLLSWTAISTNLTAPAGQTLTLSDTNANQAFYRVQSIIVKENAQLSQAILDSSDLTGADFFGAELFGASLQAAFLDGADFSGADVRTANFSGSELRGADFFGAFGSQAIFDAGTLTGADCSFADFEAGSFQQVDLTGVDFSSATLDSADFDLAFFKNVILDENTIIDAKPKQIWQIVNQGASNAALANIDLSFANFTGASFNGANLSNSALGADIMMNCDLRKANFTNADTRFIDFRGAQMDSTTIIDSRSRLVWQILNQNFGVGADLHGTNLSFVLLLGANLMGANLTNTVCTSIICENSNFGSANLTKANCNGGDFFSVILTNANLTQANFSSADLTDANLRNATTNGTVFTGATFNNTIMPDGSIRNF